MQRLFSMFPAGRPGAALLLLRFCVAGMLSPHAWLTDGIGSPVVSKLCIAALVLILCVGAFTPIGCVIALIIHVGAIVHAERLGLTDTIIHGGVVACLLILGPGAYSVDARMFGRRIVFPHDDEF